jgi:ABC-type Fe3+/spermidine/putrescine transport system ATPase subunit
MTIKEKAIFNTVSPLPSVELLEVRLSYTNKNTDGSFLLQIDQLQINGGKIHCIYGTNGCGKTSFLKLLSGAIPLSEGSITWKNISEPKPGKDFVLVSQAGPWPHWSVFKNIYEPQIELGISKDEAKQKTGDIINIMGLQGLEDRHAHQLSAGQQQRTVLARALVLSPKILLLDEVLSGQSEYWAERIASILEEFVGLGGMAIIVSHDPEWVMMNADHITHIVSAQSDDVSSARFFCGYDGHNENWPAFREERLKMFKKDI